VSAVLIDGARLADGTAGRILAVDARIAKIAGADAELDLPAGTRRLDASGLMAAPGFIDLQVNGACGRDFTSEPAAMWEVGTTLARHGVTSFLATIVSAAPGSIDHAIAAWGSAPAAEGAAPIGLHLEGPYLSPARAGAHRSSWLRPPDRAEAEGWTPAVGVRMVTLAPELPGALDLVADLAGRDVVVAAGHTDGDAATGRAAAQAGVRYLTHAFNAMRPLDHRDPGLAAALLDDPRVTVGLIADGRHVAPEILRLALRMLGPGRLSLVSDAMAGLDMAPGTMRLGDVDVLIGPEGARLADGTLAGSIAGLDACLRTLVAATGCSLADALAAVTSAPARLLGLGDGRGELAIGGRADVTLLTPELEVAATMVAGRVVWLAEAERWV
jgi:N-acetylglucosamine-6-phosphate deacetylase